jgi:hypothetical protein
MRGGRENGVGAVRDWRERADWWEKVANCSGRKIPRGGALYEWSTIRLAIRIELPRLNLADYYSNRRRSKMHRSARRHASLSIWQLLRAGCLNSCTFPVAGPGYAPRKSFLRSFVLSIPGRKDTSCRDEVVCTFWPCQFWKGEILHAVPPIGRTDNREKSLILANRNQLAIAHRVADRREVTRKQVDHPPELVPSDYFLRAKD